MLHEASAPRRDAARDPSLRLLLDSEWVAGTALAHSFLRSGRLLPTAEAAEKQRRTSEFFAGVTAGDHPAQGLDFDFLVGAFQALLSDDGVGGESEWWDRSRLWRLFFLARREEAEDGKALCFWDVSYDFAFALHAVGAAASGGGEEEEQKDDKKKKQYASAAAQRKQQQPVALLANQPRNHMLSQASAAAVLLSVPDALRRGLSKTGAAESSQLFPPPPAERVWATLLAIALLRRLRAHVLLCEPEEPHEVGVTLLDGALAWVRRAHGGRAAAEAAVRAAERAAEAQVSLWEERVLLEARGLREEARREEGRGEEEAVWSRQSALSAVWARVARSALLGCVTIASPCGIRQLCLALPACRSHENLRSHQFTLSSSPHRHETLQVFLCDVDETMPRHFKVVVLGTSLAAMLMVQLWFAYAVRKGTGGARCASAGRVRSIKEWAFPLRCRTLLVDCLVLRC